MVNKGIIVPLLLLSGQIVKSIWRTPEILDSTSKGKEIFNLTTVQNETIRLYRCNTTVVIGSMCKEYPDFWFRYYIWRSTHTCRRNCHCYNLIVDNQNGTMCKHDGEALDSVKDLIIACECHMPPNL